MAGTLERSGTVAGTDVGTKRSPWVFVLVATLVLAAGVLVGWVMRGETDGAGTVAVVTADGSDLTEEQAQMMRMLEGYLDELRNGDYEAAESWFFDDGGIRVIDGFDVPYGDFEMMLPDAPWEVEEMLDTALAYEDKIVFFHRDIVGLVRADVVRFGDFENGEFHIEEHLITD